MLVFERMLIRVMLMTKLLDNQVHIANPENVNTAPSVTKSVRQFSRPFFEVIMFLILVRLPNWVGYV